MTSPLPVTIARNAVEGRLIDATKEVKIEAQKVLSYMVAGAENSEAFKSHHWDGRSSFFDFKTATFPAGFTVYLAAALSRKGYRPQLARKPLPEPLGPEEPVVDSFGFDPKYDYQPEVVNKVLKHGQIIARVATGGGKSRIARLLYARIRRPTLFLTTRSILMYQMKEAFERDMGVAVSVLGDGQFGHTTIDANGNERQAVKKMCVGMVQTLAAKLADPSPDDPPEKQRAQLAERARVIKLLSVFEVVIGEEAHEASGNSYYEILKHCENAHYRLALTATPFMKENEESNMRLMAAFGPIGIQISEQMLIERGILAKPYFKVVQLKERPTKVYKTSAWVNAYKYGIVENDERNRAIVTEAVEAASYGLPVMVLVQRKEHGKILLDKLEAAGLQANFIFGENDQATRKQALTDLKNGAIDVLIGSTILDVGVDVPAVGAIILAGGGKAEVALRQRIGRGLRAKKSGPNVAFIVDFSDQWNEHLAKHAYQRLEIIKGTPGFSENVLGPGESFDYQSHGLAKL